MQFWNLANQADAIAARAQALMRAHHVPPLPQAFQLFFAYASGSNPSLNAAIDTAMEAGRISEISTLRNLSARYFSPSSHASLEDITSRLNAEIKRFATVLVAAGHDTAAFGQALHSAATGLAEGDVDQIGVIIEGLAGATRAIETRNRTVETELARSADEVSALRQAMEHLRSESLMDPLTSLLNRRGFEERLRALLSAHQSGGQSLAVIMTDIDHFKRFNDAWGHATGDQVLRLVAHSLRTSIRDSDIAARYGGEEFVMLLPGATLDVAETLAEKIRACVATKKIVKRATGESLGSISVSLGVTCVTAGEDVWDAINRADACLYRAKRSGRNRVCCDPDLSLAEPDPLAAG